MNSETLSELMPRYKLMLSQRKTWSRALQRLVKIRGKEYKSDIPNLQLKN